jgi:hypothetical protein
VSLWVAQSLPREPAGRRSLVLLLGAALMLAAPLLPPAPLTLGVLLAGVTALLVRLGD